MVLTLDTNALVNLEKGAPEATYLRAMINLCDQGRLCIQVPAISASESPFGGRPKSFGYFMDRLKGVGLVRCKILPTIGYWDITFVECTVWATESSLRLETRIHEILFPTIPCVYSQFLSSANESSEERLVHKRWLNAKCDVAAMWCHIKHRGDVFVTSDKNYHKISRKGHLLALGANAICTPEEALNIVTAQVT